MTRRLLLAFTLLTGCGAPSFESEAIELEYLDSLSNPTREQFLRRKQLRAAADRAEEERLRPILEARRKAELARQASEAKAIAEEEARIAEEKAELEEADRREDRAADALDADIRAAKAKGLTPETARAVYESIIERFPSTRAAAAAQTFLDNLDSP